MLTSAQLLVLKAAIAAETNAAFVILRNQGATGAIAEWFNQPSDFDAWNKSVPPSYADDAPDYSTFDSIPAGKRDSWAFFLTYPRDFSRNKVRKWVTDVWGNATVGSSSESILKAAVRRATRGEYLFGGSVKATGTVSAVDLQWTGSITNEDVVAALGS